MEGFRMAHASELVNAIMIFFNEDRIVTWVLMEVPGSITYFLILGIDPEVVLFGRISMI